MREHVRTFAAVIAAAIVCLPGCQQETTDVELPAELFGRWTTSAPKYADRFFELRGDGTVLFGLGGSQREVSPIVKVELVKDGDFLNYHISHLSETGDVYFFSLSYHTGRAGQLTFLNQPNIVWKKEKDQASLQGE